MCFDWSAPDGSRRCLWVLLVLRCLFAGAGRNSRAQWSNRAGSSEVVALSHEDEELGRVALSCHMAMDLLCQDMRDACRNSAESLGSACSLCSHGLEDSLAQEWEGREMQECWLAASHLGRAVTERRGVW